MKVGRAHRLGGATTPPPRAGLAGFQNKLAHAIVEHDTATPLLEAILEVLMKLPRVVGAGFINLDQEGLALANPSQYGGVVFGRGDYQAHLSQVSRTTLETQSVTAVASPDVKNLTTVCSPIGIENPVRQVISIAVADSPNNLETELLIPQIAAAYVVLWQLSHTTGQLDNELTATAAVLELVGRLGSCRSRKKAAYTIANDLHEFFRCDQVAVGLKKKNGICQVSAVSGLADFDQQSIAVRKLRSVFDEAIQRDEQVTWPVKEDAAKHGLVSHKQLAETLKAETIVSCPLKTVDGESNGVLTFVGSEKTLNHQTVLNVIATLSEPMGSALQLVKQAEGGLFRRTVGRSFSWLATKPGILTSIGVIVAIAAMFIPITYRIRTGCTAEPVARRMSVAPHDGLLEATHAEPGDLIKAGQLLATMDGREIRWELAGLEADTHRATKKRDAAFVKQDVPEAQMAKLEVEGLKLKSKLLQFREGNLEIRSPIDGIVLSGSLDRRENYPVTVGQALYEIAPLDQLRIEVAIPHEEITHVEIGSDVNITFDGIPGSGSDGAITAIHPRSQVREGGNVFIAEVTIDNPDRIIRPGMSGIARVYGAKRSLGWSLFHKPWEHVVSWLRW